jgi:Ca-activated chloride channel homolog
MLQTKQLPCQTRKSSRYSKFRVQYLLYFVRKSENQGFSWIEWIIVLFIVGFFAAMAAPSFLNQANKAKESEGKQYIGSMNRAQQSKYAEKGSFVGGSQIPSASPAPSTPEDSPKNGSSEEYKPIEDNVFQRVAIDPLSTFAIDVDTASYTNVRRFINESQMPPKDAVRIEEFINYFKYEYPQPERDRPFSITTEISDAPWNPDHKLVNIGLQGKNISTENLPPSNLVFLLDVSGSMSAPNKLPLLKSALHLLVNQLTEKDKVSIVVYAGAAKVVLPPTSGNEKARILASIDSLHADGSTAGGEGIKLAYKLAQQSFIPAGNNRVILGTDGDFNVGVSSDAELVSLIETYRNKNIFLSVLGFGMGNLKDAKMEQIADKGNGNFAYIDSLMEAKKVLVTQMSSTLLTISKDVKVQVEFNPSEVQAYRLIGYENRLLKSQDFNDDKKDAGELGAGHSVTALYEIIPTGVQSDVKLSNLSPLKYPNNNVYSSALGSKELMQVKLRYKAPNGTTSQLITQPVIDGGRKLENTSKNFRFAAAVAEFGMILRGSEYRGKASFDQVLKLASQSMGTDLDGYRAEFIRLVKSSQTLVANSRNSSPTQVATQTGAFTNNVDELGIGIKTQTSNYQYLIHTTGNATFQHAIPLVGAMRAYVGGVASVRNGQETTSVTVLCEADSVGTTPAVEPIVTDHGINCAPGTTEVTK